MSTCSSPSANCPGTSCPDSNGMPSTQALAPYHPLLIICPLSFPVSIIGKPHTQAPAPFHHLPTICPSSSPVSIIIGLLPASQPPAMASFPSTSLLQVLPSMHRPPAAGCGHACASPSVGSEGGCFIVRTRRVRRGIC